MWNVDITAFYNHRGVHTLHHITNPVTWYSLHPDQRFWSRSKLPKSCSTRTPHLRWPPSDISWQEVMWLPPRKLIVLTTSHDDQVYLYAKDLCTKTWGKPHFTHSTTPLSLPHSHSWSPLLPPGLMALLLPQPMGPALLSLVELPPFSSLIGGDSRGRGHGGGEALHGWASSTCRTTLSKFSQIQTIPKLGHRQQTYITQ